MNAINHTEEVTEITKRAYIHNSELGHFTLRKQILAKEVAIFSKHSSGHKCRAIVGYKGKAYRIKCDDFPSININVELLPEKAEKAEKAEKTEKTKEGE